jgi:16S rRNA (uracil1498-N3)-methyltransferase
VHRFFAPALDPGDEIVDLPRDEAEHLTRVLRMGAGDTVAVFDGRGREYAARVVAASRRDVRVQIVGELEPARESSVELTLAQAVLKGDRMDDCIRDAVMLGVHAIQPLVSRRTETTVATLLRGARLERWRRVSLASVKQSRRALLPEIRTPLPFETWLEEPLPAMKLMFVEPAAGESVDPLHVFRDAAPPAAAVMAVGPEGGWEPAECAAARQHGLRLVSLGCRTLRADAVSIAALSVLQFMWDQSC